MREASSYVSVLGMNDCGHRGGGRCPGRPQLLMLWTVTAVVVISLQAVVAYADEGDAVARWAQRAERGRAGAQVLLGFAYRDGDGAPQDYAEAARWFRRAAEQGNTTAQFELGRTYSLGNGVPQNDVEALRWYRLAAEQGHSGAQAVVAEWDQRTADKRIDLVAELRRHGLAGAYTDDDRMRPGARSPEELQARHAAANDGDADEQYLLGRVYYYGDGVAQDYVEAARWWRLAAEQGQPSAQAMLGYAYAEGHGVAQNDVEAARWYRLSAEQRVPFAQVMLASAYSEGRGVVQSDAEAVRWWRKSAEQGFAFAQLVLGYVYRDGDGVQQDDVEAARWLRLAAEQGTVAAQGTLGAMYIVGRGVPQDYVSGYAWLNIAAMQDENARELRDQVGADVMTAAQIQEAQRMSRQLWSRIEAHPNE